MLYVTKVPSKSRQYCFVFEFFAINCNLLLYSSILDTHEQFLYFLLRAKGPQCGVRYKIIHFETSFENK